MPNPDGSPINFIEAMEVIEKLRQDIRDMREAPTSNFVRCACGRMKTRGWTCPTNAEGGDCEEGR